MSKLTSDDALRLSLRSMGRIYISNHYCFSAGLYSEAHDLVIHARASGWTWKAIAQAAGLDPRTVKKLERQLP